MFSLRSTCKNIIHEQDWTTGTMPIIVLFWSQGIPRDIIGKCRLYVGGKNNKDVQVYMCTVS